MAPAALRTFDPSFKDLFSSIIINQLINYTFTFTRTIATLQGYITREFLEELLGQRDTLWQQDIRELVDHPLLEDINDCSQLSETYLNEPPSSYPTVLSTHPGQSYVERHQRRAHSAPYKPLLVGP